MPEAFCYREHREPGEECLPPSVTERRTCASTRWGTGRSRRTRCACAVAFGGICGSDLHYFHRGAVGDFRVREPLVLGHEISGIVLETGPQVQGSTPGTKAALDPARPCLRCRYCRAGRSQPVHRHVVPRQRRTLCLMSQGGFAQHLVLRQDQVIPVPADTDLQRLSVAEPLSVALHAVNRAGPLYGRRVIVTGSGPIGLLTCTRRALRRRDSMWSAPTSRMPRLPSPRDHMGATRIGQCRREPGGAGAPMRRTAAISMWHSRSSGSPDALTSLFRVLRRGGRIVQVGMLPPGAHRCP